MSDQSLVGKETARVTFPVDRSKVAELAKAFGDVDPAWHDPEAARAAGFDGVPTPPTVTVLMDHWREGGVGALVDALGLDLARVLHGEAAWEYLAPVRVGDELTGRAVVSDIATRDGKRGGTMTLIKSTTEFTNQHGNVVARRTDTLIEREM
jgi:acyl dehydratase